MRNSKEYYTEQEDEIFQLDKATTTAPLDGKKVKPHVVRRNLEDYLERKALERRLKDVFDDNDA